MLADESASDKRARAEATLDVMSDTGVAVGDEVEVAEAQAGELLIVSVSPRASVLSRPDPHDPRKELVTAANIDVVLVVVSVVSPPLHPRLIDRYLVATQRGGARAILCVNKIDLLNDSSNERSNERSDDRSNEPDAARDEVRALLAPYEAFGVPVFLVSTSTREGLEPLREEIRGKTCVAVGHSGVGKSSLVNALFTNPSGPSREAAETGHVNAATGKGRHTTTASQLHQFEGGTRLIDTPGVRSLGLWNISRRDLGWYFPDFVPFQAECRFADCSHTHEPKCGVRAAAASGALPRARYDAYTRIFESLTEGQPR